MTMSTQTLAESARLLSGVLIDSIQIYTVGDPVTTGFTVAKHLEPVGEPVAGLVQSTVLQNAIESKTEGAYSVKVSQGTELHAGWAVKVLACIAEPALVGKVLLLDKVSLNGAAMIRKAVATDFKTVNQEGKEGMV